jgi:hypothetical protein
LTASFVRVVDHLDGTRDVIIGKEAMLRPLNAREKASVEMKKLKTKQYSADHPTTNFSLPIPDHYYEFRADVTYGLGKYDTVYFSDRDQDRAWRLKSMVPFFISTDEGEFAVVGDEWGTIPGFQSVSTSMSSSGDYMKECVRTPEEMDWNAERKRRHDEQRLVVASLMMGRAKELAETRLQGENKVNFAVVTIPSLTTASTKYSQPEFTVEAVARAGLQSVSVVEESEAAVLAYQPVIAQAEVLTRRPQTIVMYYLNDITEGITVFEASSRGGESVESESKGVEGYLRLKKVAKYHFYQSVERRMQDTLGKRMYDRYTQGHYYTDETSQWGDKYGVEVTEKRPTHPLELRPALGWIMGFLRRSQWARRWGPETADVQEKIYLSAFDYVLLSHQEFWDFEREFLKTHYGNMLGRAYEKSGVKVEERAEKVDMFLLVDQSQFRNISSAIMKEALGADVKELFDPEIQPRFAASYGAARLAEYFTKQASHSSCT